MSAATTPRNFIDATVTIDDDAANSSAVPLLIGSTAIAGIVPDGRELEVYQTQGATTGARKGARVHPEITVEAQVHRLDGDFYQQAMGDLAGFVSVTADIGDYPANDITIDESYSADTRKIEAEDCILTGWSYTAGSPGQVSMTFQVIGPLKIDGVIYIPSR